MNNIYILSSAINVLPFHGKSHCDVDAAAEIDVPQGVEEVSDCITVPWAKLDYKSFLNALNNAQNKKNAVKCWQKYLENKSQIKIGVSLHAACSCGKYDCVF